MSDKAASTLGGAATPPKDETKKTSELNGVITPDEVADDPKFGTPLPTSGRDPEKSPSGADALPEGAPKILGDAVEGRVPGKEDGKGDAEEAAALNWLLGTPKAIEYDVPVTLDTPDGLAQMTFHIRQLDGSVIERLERENMDGEGPFARVERRNLNAAKVAEATVYMEDSTGRKVDPKSEEFRGRGIPPMDAMRERFKFQPGILSSLAMEIDRVAGLTPDRVGVAEKAIVIAAEN